MTEETEGLRIACARIAREAEEQTGFLDLGKLGLTALPKELFELKHLRRLLLGWGMENEEGEWIWPTRNIASNDIEADLYRLSDLPLLEALSVSDTPLHDLSPLAELAALQSLNCDFTQVADLSPLAGLTALQWLHCSETKVTDLSPLARLAALQVLKFRLARKVADLSPLAGLAALQSLNCCGTQVADLSPLAGLTALQDLNCDYTQVADLSPLAGLATLQWLDCGGTQVVDLSPLAGLAALQSLYCYNTKVADLSPLAGLATLQLLDCGDTPIVDLSPLAKLPNLRKLGFSRNQLTHIPAGFWDKPSLETLTLWEAKLPGIPTEVLSEDLNDNCLYRLRTHLQDLKSGEASISDVKLMVLGNGRAGKTQICRRLKGEDYDERIPSTHGIEVSSHPVGALFQAVARTERERSPGNPAAGLNPDSAALRPGYDNSAGQWNLWDFGGQDIYHGTHALFLKTRAVFVLVWATETEFVGEHDQDGMVFRNYPLSYWLDYVRHLAGTDSPVIVVQTQCDRPEDEALRPPLDEDALAAFPFRKVLHYSAKENRGRAALDEALAEAAVWLRERQGVNQIGIGRLKVQRRLEALREDIPQNPQYRTISQAHFRQLCAEAGGVSAPEHLLDYLHNTGAVFYRPGLFQDAIVLDQGWALEAIYAVFHRGRSYKPLRQLGGRFTRSLLEALVWQEFNPDEQALFLGMMQSCGVCFVHRSGDAKADIETEYIAPDLLPARAVVADGWAWDENGSMVIAEFAYALCHHGLLRGLMADIGGEAGINAVYWQGGFAFYEQATRSRAMIEQETGEGWRGLIRLRTQGGQSGELLARLVERLRWVQQQWGMRGEESRSAQCLAEQVFSKAIARDGKALIEEDRNDIIRPISNAIPESSLSFIPEPREGHEICISYAWADKTPEGQARGEIVERFCEAAKRRGIRIIRDTTELGMGDSLTRFMQRIGQENRVLVVLSDKYLKSANCMFELWEIWRNSRLDKEDFKQRAGVYRMDCAKIFSLKSRAEYSQYWMEEYRNLEALQKAGAVLSDKSLEEWRRMMLFAVHIDEILSFMADTLQPGSFEELERLELGQKD